MACVHTGTGRENIADVELGPIYKEKVVLRTRDSLRSPETTLSSVYIRKPSRADRRSKLTA